MLPVPRATVHSVSGQPRSALPDAATEGQIDLTILSARDLEFIATGIGWRPVAVGSASSNLTGGKCM